MEIQECFIIGSGKSILSLTNEEKDYLNNHPYTLAMNKYFLFYEKVGVIPKAIFLADKHYPGFRVFVDTIKKLNALGLSTNYYADKYYLKLFKSWHTSPVWNIKERVKIFRDHKKIIPLTIKYSQIKFFSHQFGRYKNHTWASNFQESLFWLHGSLTTAINLAYIIYPKCHIKLIGVDLYDPESFYEQEIQTRPDLIDKHYLRGKKLGIHPTASAIKDGKTMFDGILQIKRYLDVHKLELTCCNSKSLLVTKKICNYSNLLPNK